jgi:hypothetical protein
MNVHSLWVGPKLSAIQWACMNSFVRTGHNFFVYTDDVNRKLPQGVVALGLPDYLPKTPWRFGPRAGTNSGSLAAFADLVRVEHLCRQGGWWTDLDVICLRRLPEIPPCGIAVGWQDEAPDARGIRLANVAILGATAGNRDFELLRKRIWRPWLGSPWESPLKRLYHAVRLWDTVYRPWNCWWGFAGGPRAITGLVQHLKIQDQVFAHNVFYPVTYQNWRDLLVENLSDVKADLSSTVAIHLWAELYRQAGIDPNLAVRNSWMNTYLDDWTDDQSG